MLMCYNSTCNYGYGMFRDMGRYENWLIRNNVTSDHYPIFEIFKKEKFLERPFQDLKQMAMGHTVYLAQQKFMNLTLHFGIFYYRYEAEDFIIDYCDKNKLDTIDWYYRCLHIVEYRTD